ncbi:hypothetical protein ACN2C7_16740 [Caulobacter sp. ErkDOM-E]|uniref:hypothetical protein n=1 Tax=Caulobacter sp. ErkDOM-E TaxID=3402778 RepID=UPI003AF4A301
MRRSDRPLDHRSSTGRSRIDGLVTAFSVQTKKKPGSRAGQFIREETPRKGRGDKAASQVVYRVRCEIGQAEKWTLMSILLKGFEEKPMQDKGYVTPVAQ